MAIFVDDGFITKIDVLPIVGSEVELIRVSNHPYYDWDIHTFDGMLEVKQSCLKPLPPPNEATTWESMEDIWIPKELVMV